MEFTDSRLRDLLRAKCGTRCVYCGSTEFIEYHHIIPRSNGGDNRFSNVVPLCQECHHKAHNKTFNENYRGGRKEIEKPSEWEATIEDYLACKVSYLTASKKLNIGKNTFYKWRDEYLESHPEAVNLQRKGRGI